MPEIGATLREARMRARIDVSEIETQTKIRAKYLRALENEEWGLLPGPTFVKSFLRTYAQALGLDGKALVEEYRLSEERPSEGMLEPIVAPSQRGRSRPSSSGPSRGYLVAVALTAVVILVLVVLLVTDKGGSSPSKTLTTSAKAHKPTKASSRHHGHTASSAPASNEVTLSITPSANVYVCLLGDGGHRLIPGEELQSGQSTPTFHARHFALTLGNSSVTMVIDGRARTVEPSNEPIGYTITKAFGRHALAPSQRPTCE
jgi:cytoskeleton protein RodZ